MQVLIWQNGQLYADPPHEQIERACQDPHGLIWIDLADNPAKHRDLLTRKLGISSITFGSLSEPFERAKFAAGHDYFYLVVHGLAFDTATEEADTPKLDILFGPNFLVTAHRAQLPWLDTLRESVRTGKTEENMMDRGVAYLLYAVLDSLTDSYFPVLDTLDDLIDDLENATVTDTSNAVQARIFRTKRSLAQMRRVISPQVEVANSLITRTGPLIPQEAEPYFAEVHDHLVRAFEVLDSYRDLMSGLLDVYLTTVSNRLNVVMKQLTIIATIFMPITFITGVFGQNFAHSPQVEHDNGYAFWAVLLGMAIITVLQIWYFKRRGWL